MSNRIKITLDKIKCNQTEDYVGNDEFYLITALQKRGAEKPEVKVHGTWDMAKGQLRKFGPLTLHDVPVDDDAEYLFVMTCWDKDAAEEVSQADLTKAAAILEGMYGEIVEHRTRMERDAPDESNWVRAAIDGLFYLIGLLVQLDKDDALGSDETWIPISSWLADFVVNQSSKVPRTFKCSADGCDYDVSYTVEIQDL